MILFNNWLPGTEPKSCGNSGQFMGLLISVESRYPQKHPFQKVAAAGCCRTRSRRHQHQDSSQSKSMTTFPSGRPALDVPLLRHVLQLPRHQTSIAARITHDVHFRESISSHSFSGESASAPKGRCSGTSRRATPIQLSAIPK